MKSATTTPNAHPQPATHHHPAAIMTPHTTGARLVPDIRAAALVRLTAGQGRPGGATTSHRRSLQRTLDCTSESCSPGLVGHQGPRSPATSPIPVSHRQRSAASVGRRQTSLHTGILDLIGPVNRSVLDSQLPRQMTAAPCVTARGHLKPLPNRTFIPGIAAKTRCRSLFHSDPEHIT